MSRFGTRPTARMHDDGDTDDGEGSALTEDGEEVGDEAALTDDEDGDGGGDGGWYRFGVR